MAFMECHSLGRAAVTQAHHFTVTNKMQKEKSITLIFKKIHFVDTIHIMETTHLKCLFSYSERK